jgi:hypothetical protein
VTLCGDLEEELLLLMPTSQIFKAEIAVILIKEWI